MLVMRLFLMQFPTACLFFFVKLAASFAYVYYASSHDILCPYNSWYYINTKSWCFAEVCTCFFHAPYILKVKFGLLQCDKLIGSFH